MFCSKADGLVSFLFAFVLPAVHQCLCEIKERSQPPSDAENISGELKLLDTMDKTANRLQNALTLHSDTNPSHSIHMETMTTPSFSRCSSSLVLQLSLSLCKALADRTFLLLLFLPLVGVCTM